MDAGSSIGIEPGGRIITGFERAVLFVRSFSH